MKTSFHLFKNPSNKFIALFTVLALVGFIDSSYLALKYFVGGPIPCFIASGCDAVTTSVYSRILGIPIALLGAAYYCALLLLVVGYFDTKWVFIFTVASYATVIGLLTSVWLVFVQAFLLQEFCFYCLISAGTSTLLFLISWWWRIYHKIPVDARLDGDIM
jgi:uncharacterized membrane protein